MVTEHEQLQSRFGASASHIAVSGISRDKTNCAQVAIAMAGNYPKGYTTYLTDSKAHSYLRDTIHTMNVVQATLIKCKPRKIEKLIVKPKTTCFGFQNGVFCVRI